MREYPAERFFRELRVDRIWEGTSEIQRLIVARAMEKRGVVEGRRVSARGAKATDAPTVAPATPRRSTSGRSSLRAPSPSSAPRRGAGIAKTVRTT